jgi:uncharacterized protein (DUF433 family)
MRENPLSRPNFRVYNGIAMTKQPDRIKMLPAYTLAEAARLVGSKPSTLGTWFHGRQYTVKGAKKTWSPVLTTQSSKGAPISFIDLVEAHIFLLIRRRYHIPVKNVRAAAEYLHQIKPHLRSLAHQDFYVDSSHLILKLDDKMISLSERGQIVDKDILESGLKQLNYGSDGYASEFYPRTGVADQKTLVISPALNFGRLCIARSGISADIVAARFLNGEKIADIATDFGATLDEVEEAIRWHDRLAA